MKSFTIITCTFIVTLITFILTAFAYPSWNEVTVSKHSCKSAEKIEPPTFFYELTSGCKNTLSKERAHNAITISDLVPDYSIQEALKNNTLFLRDVNIKIEEGNDQNPNHNSEKRNENRLTNEQVTLLQTTDYSTNIFLEGFLTKDNLVKDPSTDRYFNYCMTIVPEHTASYKDGDNAFLHYLKTKSQSTVNKLQKGNLASGSIAFDVTKTGSISNISLISTCGYPSVDERMLDLISSLPETWNVATDGNGENVNQSLIFTYGQTGC